MEQVFGSCGNVRKDGDVYRLDVELSPEEIGMLRALIGKTSGGDRRLADLYSLLCEVDAPWPGVYGHNEDHSNLPLRFNW